MFQFITAARNQVAQWLEQRTLDRMATEQYDLYQARIAAEAQEAEEAAATEVAIAYFEELHRVDYEIAQQEAALWEAMSPDEKAEPLFGFDHLEAVS